MSVFYNMETFILPRGLLMMHSGSLMFQKTPIFHTGSYVLEFTLLLLLLVTGLALYIYANLKNTEKPSKTSKMKKMNTPGPKSIPKVKNSSKSSPEKAVVVKTHTSGNKKRLPLTASNNSSENVTNLGNSKKKYYSRSVYPSVPQHSRLKSEIQRSTDENEKPLINQCEELNSVSNSKEVNLTRECDKRENIRSKNTKKELAAKNKSTKYSRNICNTNNGKVTGGHQSSTTEMAIIQTPVELIEVVAMEWFDPNYSHEEIMYIENLSYYVIPTCRLAGFGYPFIDCRNSDFGVFFHRNKYVTQFELDRQLEDSEPREYFASNSKQQSKQCSRCKKYFSLMQKEKCCYHSGKFFSKYGAMATYSCCQQSKESQGCEEANDHVWDGIVPGMNGPVDGFVFTQPSPYPFTKHRVVALDCEMCYTILGLEVTRVTMLDLRGEVIYDSLVKPENPIIDYNTRFSGITKELMERPGAAKPLKEVQEDILDLVDYNTIMIGHGLENDLRVLKIVHSTIIDTAILFRNPEEPNTLKKYSLKNLSWWYLHRNIQASDAGHDSIADASACLDLVQFMVNSGLCAPPTCANS